MPVINAAVCARGRFQDAWGRQPRKRCCQRATPKALVCVAGLGSSVSSMGSVWRFNLSKAAMGPLLSRTAAVRGGSVAGCCVGATSMSLVTDSASLAAWV
jgi:hypothetical protein